ncbi:2-dehydropantoate 2-reductase (plasmid) [Microvirga ossetica]|uniref:2-dehydropantoate 2-reductase n=1 Tax=Microvirga ossetica TaxID=1882682 RepID=A0A1B2ETB1_9HYPH|nr:2-dehydropantoate 2-reductase [Microvirga ossetica]ANY83179.1 2-dehydropantoate 2-reductase [Microvirga ossetica]
MRVAVVGVGAIGGWMAFKMAQAGFEVSALARGATLTALREYGVRLRRGDEVGSYPIKASDNASALGKQDLVVLAVKGPALAAAAPAASALLGPDTIVLPAMNGVPWWFFEGLPGPFSGRRLTAIDPDGQIDVAMPARHVIGCVVHAACTTSEPGVTVQRAGNGLIVGESHGGGSARLDRVTEVLRGSGFDVEVSSRIQQAIWYKLWGNMTMNPISAITGATADRILDDPLVRAFILRVMAEAAQIGDKIGCPITESGEDRNAVTRKLGAFKTSMLQDVEAGRPIELDVLLSAPREIAQWLGIETPAMDGLLGLARLFGRSRGLYPEAVKDIPAVSA